MWKHSEISKIRNDQKRVQDIWSSVNLFSLHSYIFIFYFSADMSNKFIKNMGHKKYIFCYI